ncbi:hypothetical protein PMAYCL1PPCAC_01690 [Pristionchus mayeri]|uniref:Uncharacterized protein n=1 Tax=Pristionchus mayeri TaxID=1317129 RepID=A0AAN4Z5A7_9BILA|nr:hypothetical protein PMAYCL1PPCAC_01690 [Pristionchus mayeri]
MADKDQMKKKYAVSDMCFICELKRRRAAMKARVPLPHLLHSLDLAHTEYERGELGEGGKLLIQWLDQEYMYTFKKGMTLEDMVLEFSDRDKSIEMHFKSPEEMKELKRDIAAYQNKKNCGGRH